MNTRELRAVMSRKGYSIPQLADAIGIGKKAFYQKIRGETEFKLCEIKNIAATLELTQADINAIFFEQEVA